MAVLYSRTFRFAKAEWYEAWVTHFEDIYALEEAVRKAWPGQQVKVGIRHDNLLEVTFVGLNDRGDDVLVQSVLAAFRAPLPSDANALDVVEHILQEGS